MLKHTLGFYWSSDKMSLKFLKRISDLNPPHNSKCQKLAFSLSIFSGMFLMKYFHSSTRVIVPDKCCFKITFCFHYFQCQKFSGKYICFWFFYSTNTKIEWGFVSSDNYIIVNLIHFRHCSVVKRMFWLILVSCRLTL